MDLLKTCRSLTLLDNTSETVVSLQKIGHQVEFFTCINQNRETVNIKGSITYLTVGTFW